MSLDHSCLDEDCSEDVEADEAAGGDVGSGEDWAGCGNDFHAPYCLCFPRVGTRHLVSLNILEFEQISHDFSPF